MPYLLFLFGLIFALFTLYRFFVTASVPEMSSALKKAFIGLFVFALLFFALTGKIQVSIFLVILTVPFIISHYRAAYKKSKSPPHHEDIIENEATQNDD